MAAAPDEIQIVFGLGNPGPEYARTRHNAGFSTVDVLAGRLGTPYWKSQLGSQVAKVRFQGREIVLAKPQSFMNSSGGPVSKLLAELGFTPEQTLVIHDDLDIPAWDIRVKFGGGHGGHNGLRSIIEKCGSRDFSRLRFGLGRPPGRMDSADFVLRELKGEFAEEFDICCQKAADAVELCLEKGVIPARDALNGLHREKDAAAE